MREKNKDFPLKDYYGSIYRTYDRVNRVFTFGRDKSWRKAAVNACLEHSPVNIIDVCTGTGDLVIEIGKRSLPGLHLTGFDFSPEMMKLAREKSTRLGLSIDFIEGEVSSLPFGDESFDVIGITFGIRNLVYENSLAGKHLSELRRVLRNGGRFVILESSKPGNILWRFFNSIYLKFILPYLGGLLSGNLEAYKYLARSSKNYYSRREMARILEQAGFRMVSDRSLFLGSVMLLVAEKQAISSPGKAGISP